MFYQAHSTDPRERNLENDTENVNADVLSEDSQEMDADNSTSLDDEFADDGDDL